MGSNIWMKYSYLPSNDIENSKQGSNNCELDITLNEQSTLMTYMIELKPWHFPICPIRIDIGILWWHISKTNMYKYIQKNLKRYVSTNLK